MKYAPRPGTAPVSVDNVRQAVWLLRVPSGSTVIDGDRQGLRLPQIGQQLDDVSPNHSIAPNKQVAAVVEADELPAGDAAGGVLRRSVLRVAPTVWAMPRAESKPPSARRHSFSTVMRSLSFA